MTIRIKDLWRVHDSIYALISHSKLPRETTLMLLPMATGLHNELQIYEHHRKQKLHALGLDVPAPAKPRWKFWLSPQEHTQAIQAKRKALIEEFNKDMGDLAEEEIAPLPPALALSDLEGVVLKPVDVVALVNLGVLRA